MHSPLGHGVVNVFILLVISLLVAWAILERHHVQAGGERASRPVSESGKPAAVRPAALTPHSVRQTHARPRLRLSVSGDVGFSFRTPPGRSAHLHRPGREFERDIRKKSSNFLLLFCGADEARARAAARADAAVFLTPRLRSAATPQGSRSRVRAGYMQKEQQFLAAFLRCGRGSNSRPPA